MLFGALCSLFLSTSAVAWSPAGNWAVPSRTDGYDKITSRFYINANSTWSQGYYAALQTYFQGHGTHYFGLQPRTDGISTGRVVYSAFGNGTTVGDPSCRPGADNTPGVSCATAHTLKTNEWYTIQSAVVETNAQGGRRWNGTLIDGSGRRFFIGSFWTDSTFKALKGTGGQWLEWYKFNGDGLTAAQRACQPPFTAKYEHPFLYAGSSVKIQGTDTGFRGAGNLDDKCAVAAGKPNYSIAFGDTQIQITAGIYDQYA